MSAKKRPVVWTEVATKDLERLAGYLAGEAPLRAKGIIDGIVARAESLARAPNRGRIPHELRSVGQQEWREVQAPPWRILYRVAESRVEIHGVLDGRRNLEDILMERMLRS